MKQRGWIILATVIVGFLLLAGFDKCISMHFREWMGPIFLVLLASSQIYIYASGMMRDSMPVIGPIAALVFWAMVIWLSELVLFWILTFLTWGSCGVG
jgi:hypothetical protein